MHDVLGTDAGLRALVARDITTVYKLLCSAGVGQRDIAAMTGQSQSEVSEILNGRQVMAYDVFVRIADGLGVPRGIMGLGYADADGNPVDYPESETADEVDEEMIKRRALLASAGFALFDHPVLGKVLELPKRPEVPTPLPSRLGASDITALDALTAEFRAWAQRWGGGAATIGATARRSEQLLTVSASDILTGRLHSALAQLHTVAGWAAFDECLDDTARDHFGRAISLTGAADDPYWIGFALYGGGIIVAESGHPNDALKHYQLAHFAVARDDGRHANAPALTGWLHAESALGLAALKHKSVREELAALKDAEPNASLLNLTARTHLRMGNLGVAQSFAVGAVEQYEGSPKRRHTVLADITLAMVYVLAGGASWPTAGT
jgi:transcriptional regulator with XRE-family HTH domain